MTEQGNRDSNGRWKGTTGNAAGRGMTNRRRISEKLLGDRLISATAAFNQPFGTGPRLYQSYL
jgi:hypothetical protein